MVVSSTMQYAHCYLINGTHNELYAAVGEFIEDATYAFLHK